MLVMCIIQIFRYSLLVLLTHHSFHSIHVHSNNMFHFTRAFDGCCFRSPQILCVLPLLRHSDERVEILVRMKNRQKNRIQRLRIVEKHRKVDSVARSSAESRSRRLCRLYVNTFNHKSLSIYLQWQVFLFRCFIPSISHRSSPDILCGGTSSSCK